jgi:molybdopterin/thiamine biosynthesis adenylyltransferase
MFTKSKAHHYLVTYRTKQLPGVEDRQKLLEGFSQEALTQAKVIMIGAGGLGGEIGEALVRKGVGTLTIFDFDVVELSNLNRQLFGKNDPGRPKAHCLARNLSKLGFLGSRIEGYSLSFQDALQYGVAMADNVSVVVCGVDNNPCRIAVSTYYQKQKIPVVFTSVSVDASHGYVFVQEPGKACFVCQFPKALNDETYPCGTPAVKDILKVVSGIVSYAVDSLLMERLRTWSYKHCYLDGTIPGKDWLVPRSQDCPLCGTPQDHLPDTIRHPASQTRIPAGQTCLGPGKTDGGRL